MATAVSTAIEIERHSDVAALAREWEALAERCAASPFAYPGWFDAWYAAFGRGRPLLLAARRAGRLVGVLPLERRAATLRAAANWHTPVFAPPVEDAGAAEALAAALLRERAAGFDLTLLDADDPVLEALRAVGPAPLERAVARQPFVDTSGTFADYDAAQPRKRRKELRRLRRRLDEEGEAAFEFTAGGEALAALLDEGFAIEGSGWKTGTAIADDATVEGFYRGIARWADARGWLVLAFLRLDGRALAFDLQLEAAGAAYVLKGGFDPEQRRLSPGTLLTHESLERAFGADHLRSYEFLGDADEYKLAWTDSVRERVRLQAFPRTPAGAVNRLAWTRGRDAALRLRDAARRER